ncbi:KamA family radical SAM protein [Melioribacteraceae bacterium 4301-Me]|uniref:KamA family radical SAM protein n=1 Tax=Pyranulibacter aquaticus TaxID=3163344 RepID=UPI003594FC17
MKNYKSYTLRNFNELPQIKNLSEEEKRAIIVVGNVLPFKTNNYVIEELIDWSNIPDDPIFTLTFPRREMLKESHYSLMEKTINESNDRNIITQTANSIRMELNPHPAGQLHNVPTINGIELNGMQHKYRETVLFFPSQGQTCHAYCTFCFRWPQFVGLNELKFAMRETELLVEYLKNHREITDVLFTGGDPLIMKTKILSTYIEPLLDDELWNIQTIRIGTKAIGYWPYRFTDDKDSDDLIRLFEKIVKSKKNLAVMAHFNHPVELKTKAAEEAIKRIRATGGQIRTQSPILKHINDSPEIWSELWRLQVNNNCIPYYMFVARDTGAQEFFGVTLENAWQIFRQAYQNVSGVCRTVRGPSMSTTPGKIQVLGIEEVDNEKVFVLRFLQGRNPDWVAKPFFAKYDKNAIWLDELKPAFGKETFFFEKELEEMFNEHIYDDESENFE